jgi:hypothetical protein
LLIRGSRHASVELSPSDFDIPAGIDYFKAHTIRITNGALLGRLALVFGHERDKDKISRNPPG